MKIVLSVAFLAIIRLVYSQTPECNLKLTGKVLDLHDQEIIASVQVIIQEIDRTVFSDSSGNYLFTALCPGKYTVICNPHNGQKSSKKTIELTTDTTFDFSFEIHSEQLNEVLISVHQVKDEEIESLQKTEIGGLELSKARGLSLGESLKAIPGVTSLQTGPSISKPMIHGLYGNRVLLLSNGVRLEGQNWGAEHAPEIDPFIASTLSVIRGAASIRYGMEAIAGVVLVEPASLPRTKLLKGQIHSVGATNGRSGTVSGQLEGGFSGKMKGLGWRLQGTSKKAGSAKTPTYYLSNTAMNEQNYSAALSYARKRFEIETYYSHFESKIGIYSGSNVGNLTDLLYLFNSPEPVVPSLFSYQINRAYQQVQHDLLKVKGCLHLKPGGNISYTFSYQQNKRSEFGEDIPYNQTLADKNLPDAYFQLVTHASDIVWEHKTIGHFSGSLGTQLATQGNIFNGLEFRALIPNYRNYTGGIFLLEKWNKNRWTLEAGARFDYKWMKAYRVNYTTLANYTTEQQWQNGTGTLGSVFRINEFLQFHSSLGMGWRPPAAIELYSLGIHQSAASFEIGDSTLQAEKSYNIQSYLNFEKKKWNLEVGAYFNLINDFIYLNPLTQPIVTISGTYPAFEYKQANVYYSGIDANLNWQIQQHIRLFSKTTLVFAYNLAIKDYLIYVPANRTENGLSLTLDKLHKLEELYFDCSVLMVSKQNRVPDNTDYVPAPAGYALINLNLGFSIPIKQQSITVNFAVNNLTNTVYRDYLDRFRYYANSQGRNFVLRLQVPFSIFSTTEEK